MVKQKLKCKRIVFRQPFCRKGLTKIRSIFEIDKLQIIRYCVQLSCFGLSYETL